MFSGIIEHVGRVISVSLRPQAMDLSVSTGFTDLSSGESISVNGVCLTVVKFTEKGNVDFHLSGETLSRTALGGLQPRQSVNLERAVALQTRLSGHIVQGHVDTIGTITQIEAQGNSHRLIVHLPQHLRRYIVEKGSITLNGISLTVNTIHEAGSHEARAGEDATFGISLMIIPHTWHHTDLSSLSVGAKMNVEVDVLAKYVETLMRFSPVGSSGSVYLGGGQS